MDISTEIAAIEAASEGEELRQPLIDALDALNSGSLPAVTSSDAGKILKVNSSGEWVAGEKSGYMPTPTESINITENGTVNVLNYAQAVVLVSGGGGGTVLTITDYDYYKFPGITKTERSFAHSGIILPFLFSPDISVETDFMFTRNTADQNAIGTFDTVNTGNITWCRILNEGNNIYFGNGTLSGQIAYNAGNYVNKKYSYKNNINGKIILDNNEIGSYTPSTPSNDVYYMLGDNKMSSQRGYFTGRIYSYKLNNINNDTVICDLVPVRVSNSTNPSMLNPSFYIDGLLDKISGVLYTVLGGECGND